MRSPLPTCVICKQCSVANLIGAELCDGCGTLLTRDVSSKKDKQKKLAADSGKTAAQAALVIFEINGGTLAQKAQFVVPIPQDKLLNNDPIAIGRRRSRTPDQKPEIDFGFLFYYSDHQYISRDTATLLGSRGKVTIRRAGQPMISIKRVGSEVNCPLMHNVPVEIHNGDVLTFGKPPNYFRTRVVLPPDIMSRI